jgi:hypothetical protein
MVLNDIFVFILLKAYGHSYNNKNIGSSTREAQSPISKFTIEVKSHGSMHQAQARRESPP